MQTKEKRKFIILFLAIFFSFLLLQFILVNIVEAGHSLTNVYWYKDIAEKISQKGIFNIWTPYPQLFSVLIYILYFVSTAKYFVIVWQVLNIILLFGISCVIYLLLKNIVGRPVSVISALSYLLINFTWTSVITIGAFIDQIEYYVVFIMVFTLYLLLKNKIWMSSILCAIGASIKLFPILIVLVAYLVLDKKNFIKYIFIFSLVLVSIMLPFFIANQEIFISWFNFSSQREAWESIYSFPDFNAPPIVPVDNMSIPVAYEPGINILLYIQALMILIFIFFMKKREMAKKGLLNIYLLTLNLLFIFLIFSKGFSAYFIFWFFPLLFLVYKPQYAFLISALFLIVGNFVYTSLFWESVLLRYYLIIILLTVNSIKLFKPKKLIFLFIK